ncbi:hypothetical protein [Halobacterium litoreum]|uniref:Uncharacterized protein n=1 Tax=Halobacterium litoreum TaxID=2039234 RepID=A0ABD5NAE3_9EURY|nr:hypothetical protein [Halobacterium litoreum]UHH12115.1 hypothetical protein LT972_08090 [Halobacterium litoreum]
MAEVLQLAFAAFVSVTLVALGVYIGALRALDVFYSEQDSIFLSDDAGPRE